MFSRVAFAMAIVTLTIAAPAAAQESTLEAGIHAGDCQEVGQVTSPLLAPAMATGPQQGSTDNEPAANSFSTVDVPLTQLTIQEQALVVSAPGGDILACGAIGGSLTEAGALVMGLAATNDSNVTGIAFLAPSADGGQTNISLFVTGASLAQTETTESNQVQQATDDETVDSTQPEATQAPEPSIPPTPTPVPLPTQALGTTSENPAPFFEPVTNGGSTVTLLNGYFANAYGYSTPKGGYKYLVLDVRIDCASSDDCHANTMNFSGEDADTGAGYDSVVFAVAEGMLSSETLSPGEYVTGTVLLEVQETASRVIVKYDPKQFDTNDLYWIFQ